MKALTSGHERWRDNWRVVSPADAVRVDVHRRASKRLASMRLIGELPHGTPVVLIAAAPGAIRRCRRFAEEAGIDLERTYLAFPSARAPAYLVEDAPESVRFFVDSILVAPTRSVFSAPIDAGVRILRALNRMTLVRALAPGRVVVGRRSA